jgi:hypothetical protein
MRSDGMPTRRPGPHISALVGIALVVVACGGATRDSGAPTADCTTLAPGSPGSPSPNTTPCVIGAVTAPPTIGPSGSTAAIEEWLGQAEIDSKAVYPSPDSDTCQDGWTLTFDFAVDAEGKVQGTGTGVLTSAPVCPFMIGTDPAAVSWRTVAFNVLGNRSPSGLELRFALVSSEPAGTATMAGFSAMFGGVTVPDGGPPVTVPVVGRSGQAVGSWQFESGNPAAVYSATGPIAVKCSACD